jgi:hypothetical protein
MLLVTILILPAPRLQGQENTLGLNLRVNVSPQVGVTWLPTPSFAIRPSLTASWIKTTSPIGGGTTRTTQLGADLDFLFRAGTWGHVTSYFGVGGSVLRFSFDGGPEGTIVIARALFGTRVTLVDRVALFGEVGLEYQDADPIGSQRIGLATFPLGVVVFLR